MHDSGFRSRRGWVLGVLAAASLSSACGVLPRQGSEFEQVYEVPPGTPRGAEVFQPNRTIKDLPTSIDPRTPESMGTPGRSLRMDRGEQALLERYGERAYGGAGLERQRLPSSEGHPGIGRLEQEGVGQEGTRQEGGFGGRSEQGGNGGGQQPR